MGLYHCDGIIYIPNSNSPNSSPIQKKVIRAFKFLGFKIEVSSNNKRVNLDVTLDLLNNSYKHFLKTDQYPSYINVNTNDLKTIIKQVLKAVKLRISNLSANEKIFQECNKIYMDVLKNSGFREEFTYQEENIPNDINKESKKCCQKNRKRKIIWFNPAFCSLASINVGKYLLKFNG